MLPYQNSQFFFVDTKNPGDYYLPTSSDQVLMSMILNTALSPNKVSLYCGSVRIFEAQGEVHQQFDMQNYCGPEGFHVVKTESGTSSMTFFYQNTNLAGIADFNTIGYLFIAVLILVIINFLDFIRRFYAKNRS